MSSLPPRRDARIAAFLAETAQVSALSVLFSQAIADRVGINSTDLESLDILRRQGPLTAGRLAELTGLTTGGAITALIDRLERRGFALREADPNDRRRVLVRVLDRAERELGPLYAELLHGLGDLIAGYSDKEIDAILDYTFRSNRLLAEQIARVRGLDAAPTGAPGMPDKAGREQRR